MDVSWKVLHFDLDWNVVNVAELSQLFEPSDEDIAY